MIVAGALLHFGFCNAVAGFFGQPAATEVAFAAACAFALAAEPLVPEETVTFVNLALCVVAAFASTCLLCAVSGTEIPMVVLVVELDGRSVDRPVSSNAAPRRQPMRYVEFDPNRSTAVDPRLLGGLSPACALPLDATLCKRLVASAADLQ